MTACNYIINLLDRLYRYLHVVHVAHVLHAIISAEYVICFHGQILLNTVNYNLRMSVSSTDLQETEHKCLFRTKKTERRTDHQTFNCAWPTTGKL